MCFFFFFLIPNYIGINKNEEADRSAVAAAKGIEQYIPVYYRDWFLTIARSIEVERNSEWEGKKQKMYEIKKNVGPWRDMKKLTRREEVVLHRLRRGHTATQWRIVRFRCHLYVSIVIVS